MKENKKDYMKMIWDNLGNSVQYKVSDLTFLTITDFDDEWELARKEYLDALDNISKNAEEELKRGATINEINNKLNEQEEKYNLKLHDIRNKKMKIYRESGLEKIYNDKIQGYKDQMSNLINNGKSFVLNSDNYGSSGSLRNIAPDCISVAVRNGCLIEELIGDERDGQWIEPYWYAGIKSICKREPDSNHVLLITDLDNTTDEYKKLMYNIISKRSVSDGYGKLPDNCVIVVTDHNKEKLNDVNKEEDIERE